MIIHGVLYKQKNVTGKVFGDSGNESLWQIKIDF